MTSTSISPAPAKAKERILFEAAPMVLPAILTYENMALIGILLVAALAFVFFHLGIEELIIIAVLWALLAFPSFRGVFDSGSTSYVLTNRRLIIFTVSIRNKETSIPLDEIQSASCKYSGLQRLYGSGDVVVQRKGFKRPLRLRALPKSKQIAGQIMQAVKAYAA